MPPGYGAQRRTGIYSNPMATPLAPARLEKARRDYHLFNVLNSSAFVFQSGSFLTLFALRLGASRAVIGVINALAYATFFFLPLGKRFLPRRPIVWVFGWGWMGRNIAMLPALTAPAFAASGKPGVALGMLLASAAGFALFRGMALIGNNPVLDYLASGGGDRPRTDRGAFIMSISIVNSVSAMVAGLVVSLFLGENATPSTYAVLMGAGIAIGLVASSILLRTPEPQGYRAAESESVMDSARVAFKDPSFRLYIEAFIILAFIGGMARSFLPVYAKDAFSQGDDAVMVFSIMGFIGSVSMGLLTRLVVDRLGSKPLFIIFAGIALISILPIALIPGGTAMLRSPTSIGLFLAFLHFASSFGFSGEENVGQTYFFSLVPKEKTLNLGVVYFFAFGFGGAIGAGTGGVILDLFSWLGLDASNSYRVLYAALALLLTYALVRMRGLKKLGSASIAESLSVLLSPKDLRAFDLLARLDRSQDPDEEIRLIREIGKSDSTMSQHELAAYLGSPRFEVRMEALHAMETMPTLDARLVRPLMQEVETHVFTTAYVAARVLGRHAKLEALQTLRRAVEAEDYMLQGTAMVALARMGDRDSIPLVESVLQKAQNPRVRISAAYALEMFGSRGSLPALAASLRHDDPPAFVSDEVVLAMASILGFRNDFYPMYSAFLAEPSHGTGLLRASASERAQSAGRFGFEAWDAALGSLLREPDPDGRAMAGIVLDAGRDGQEAFVLAASLTDPALAYRGLRFLAAAYPVLVRQQLTDLPDVPVA